MYLLKDGMVVLADLILLGMSPGVQQELRNLRCKGIDSKITEFAIATPCMHLLRRSDSSCTAADPCESVRQLWWSKSSALMLK